MNGLPYYRAYPRDFIEGTVGMPFELKAAYRLVLDLIYMHAGQLPDDPRYIAGVLGCSVKRWIPIRKALVDSGKIIASQGYLGNLRADQELDRLAILQNKQRENALGRNKINGIAPAVAGPRLNHTEPEPEPYKEKETSKEVSKKKARRATRLDAGWTLPDTWRDWTIGALGWTPHRTAAEADRFRDYWHAKSGQQATKLDWEATWRNWCRNARPPPGTRSARDEENDRIAAAAFAKIRSAH